LFALNHCFTTIQQWSISCLKTVWVVYSDPCFPDAKKVPPAVVVQHFVSLFPQKYPVPGFATIALLA
jgi:hypothetical protein